MLKQRIIRLKEAIKQLEQADKPHVILLEEIDGLITECSAWVKGCPVLPCRPCDPCLRAMEDTVILVDDIGSDDDE